MLFSNLPIKKMVTKKRKRTVFKKPYGNCKHSHLVKQELFRLCITCGKQYA